MSNIINEYFWQTTIILQANRYFKTDTNLDKTSYFQWNKGLYLVAEVLFRRQHAEVS